jgi:hypothetical protein
MSEFTEFSAPLRIQYDKEASAILRADHWRVTESFRYFIGGKDTQQWVTVPARLPDRRRQRAQGLVVADPALGRLWPGRRGP